jgi:hypothetical protein
MKLDVSRQGLENSQIQNFMPIRLVRVELLHADGRRGEQNDRHKEANSRFW